MTVTMDSRAISRRAVLGGGAVALCLPWLETLAPRVAKAAAPVPIRRYMSMYFPNGTTDNFWLPTAVGSGNAWSPSAIMEPLLPSKQYMLVLNGVGNYSAFNATATVSPSHGTNCGGAYHCYDARKSTLIDQGGGISVDQVIAQQIGALTALPYLAVGLSTLDSSCDSTPCGHSRSISWAGPNMPLYKIVNPQAVFDRLVTAGAPATPGLTVAKTPVGQTLAQTRALKKSVLDAVLDSAKTLRNKLSSGDQKRIDAYMTSVRNLELLVAAPGMTSCSTPTLAAACATLRRIRRSSSSSSSKRWSGKKHQMYTSLCGLPIRSMRPWRWTSRIGFHGRS